MKQFCVFVTETRHVMEDYKGAELKPGEHEYEIMFEETVSQAFTVHAATMAEAKREAMEAYRHASIVLEPGDLVDTRCMVIEEDGKNVSADDDWEEV